MFSPISMMSLSCEFKIQKSHSFKFQTLTYINFDSAFQNINWCSVFGHKQQLQLKRGENIKTLSKSNERVLNLFANKE